ncbi:hypothetical protein RJ639_028086 [Escallonia herrerae]|uniref:Pentatricopeptide repeat-containing protein n=1 Tax=Escallonia herrerae TaxID=1293975 RepID=A0AA88X551_9ASTE|nr:hypothetical protein RJ639_028086 [Escallonia herrerae]
MAIRSLSGRTRAAHHHLLSHISHPRPFSTHPPEPDPPPSPDLINDLSRILSDFRSPHHDVVSALQPFSPNITPNVVEQTLKRCKNLGFSAHRFFIWAQKLPHFQHSNDSYRILVDILGSSKQFPLIWDFLVEIRDTQCCRITPEIFWIIFRAYSRANLPADAIRAFGKMGEFGIQPGIDDLDQVVYALCKRKHVKDAHQLFDKIKHDFPARAKTYSILMRGWGGIGEVDEARKLFDEMLERGCAVDVLACNCVVEALCKGGKADEAFELFRMMRSKGVEPDAFTYSIFIHASCEANDVRSAFRVLDRMKRYGLLPNVFTYNCIIKKLCKNDSVEEAYQLLDEMIERGVRPDVWSYNSILAFHCDHSEVTKALRLISRMDKDSCKPDRHTYNMVLKLLIRIGRFDRVTKVWDSMDKRGFYPSACTYAVMIHGLCQKKGKLDEASRYFEMMVDDGVPPYLCTCEVLRNRLIGFGLSEQVSILADKMVRSTSCKIQELSNVMRGNKTNLRIRRKEDDSDESDVQMVVPRWFKLGIGGEGSEN